MCPFVDSARIEAGKSPMAKQHGAVLVKNGKIIARGHNRYKQRAMTTVKDTSPEREARLRARFRRYNRISNNDPITFHQFCRLDGRLAASVHAEEDAVMRAGSRAHGATLYVVRFARNNHEFTDIPAASCPCKRCTKVCQRNKIKVFYSEETARLSE